MNNSNMVKSFSVRTFFQSLLFSTVLFTVVACFYWQSRDMGISQGPMDYAAIFVFLTCFGMLQWIVQKNTLSRLAANRNESSADPAAATGPRISPIERETLKKTEKRLFVHLFSILQREGRLLDFLQEDLSHYADDQIGAAVRIIHENCKNTIANYLSPEPIMKQAEGETVEIAPGFDRHAVKLMGNVVGEPPFTGILRHRGWQLRSISLPNLSEMENPNLVAPAVVEIP